MLEDFLQPRFQASLSAASWTSGSVEAPATPSSPRVVRGNFGKSQQGTSSRLEGLNILLTENLKPIQKPLTTYEVDFQNNLNHSFLTNLPNTNMEMLNCLMPAVGPPPNRMEVSSSLDIFQGKQNISSLQKRRDSSDDLETGRNPISDMEPNPANSTRPQAIESKLNRTSRMAPSACSGLIYWHQGGEPTYTGQHSHRSSILYRPK